jgi:hypothetical protein
MKLKILPMCFLAFLAGVGLTELYAEEANAQVLAQAQAPRPEPEAEPHGAEAEARPELPIEERTELSAEERTDLQELEAEVRQVDPHGRLTSDQLFRLLMEREKQRRHSAEFDPTPAIITIFLSGSLLTGFLAWLYAGFRKERQRHETVHLMVEKGAEVPSGLLAPAPKRPSDLRRGLILSTAGLGLTIFLAVLPDATGAWGAGLTLTLIGVGHLLVWRMQSGKGSWSSALVSEPQP